MSSIPSLAAAVLALGTIASTHSQVFNLDDFETGGFAVGGPTSFSQTLPEQNVLGGVRNVSLNMDSAAVSNGQLTMVRTDNSILRLSYGSFGDANPAEHLHFDAGPSGESTLDIAIPVVLRDPLVVIARFYSFTLDGGTPQHQYSTASYQFYSHEPLHESIALKDFVGDANFRDIAGFELQLGDIDFTRGTLNVSGATLTVIPEPRTYALAVGAGLCLWAGLQKQRQRVPL